MRKRDAHKDERRKAEIGIYDRSYCRSYYQRNKEKMLEKNRLFREKNPDYAKKYMKSYYQKHRKYALRYAAEYRAKKRSTMVISGDEPSGE